LLRRAFGDALRTGRRARAETRIGAGAWSLPSLGIRGAADRLGTLQGRAALVIGAGEMGRTAATALLRSGVDDITVTGRTGRRAQELAEAVGGRAVGVDRLSDALAAVDVVMTATNGAGLVLDRPLVAAVMARRPARPLVVIDLAVPRDADPALARIPGVTLFDQDDLRRAAIDVLAERRRHLPAVERLVTAEVERFQRETSARDIGPLVSALRCHVEEVRRAELRRWQGRVGPLDPDATALVEAVTAGVVAKLLHAPTVRLKAAAGTPEADRYREALAALFDVH
jgi:glutamyl-tRNA reductase